MVRMYGLSRLIKSSVMKTMRIINQSNRCSYVERQFFRRWWVRVSPKYRTVIEAYNYVRKSGDVNFIKK